MEDFYTNKKTNLINILTLVILNAKKKWIVCILNLKKSKGKKIFFFIKLNNKYFFFNKGQIIDLGLPEKEKQKLQKV